MFFIFVTWCVVRNFVFVQTARVSTLSLSCLKTHDFKVVPLATSTAGLAMRRTGCFAALVGIFRLFSLDSSFSWLLLRDFQARSLANWKSSIMTSAISSRLSLLNLRRPRLPPGHFIFYYSGPGFLRVPWPYQCLKTVGLEAVDFICSFCELLLNQIWVLFHGWCHKVHVSAYCLNLVWNAVIL